MNHPKVPPRKTPERDSKYMGLAWIHAGFSKDPSTQVGAQIVDRFNEPLGSGYNGPPGKIDDNSFSWERPSADDPEAFSKYDVILHAEHNAIKHSKHRTDDLSDATLYVTAFPCKKCMLEIVEAEIGRVVYMDFRSSNGSILQNTKGREVALQIARMGGVRIEDFKAGIGWVADWVEKLRGLSLFDI